MEFTLRRAVLLLLAIAVHTSLARRLPSGITPCSRNEPDLNACALRNGRLAIPILLKGIPSYGLPPFDPLRISEIRIDDPSSGRQVALDLTMRDVDIVGLRDISLDSISIDLSRKQASWSCSIPRVSLFGNYNASGRVLLLPIKGFGKMNITLDDLRLKYKFDYNLAQRGKDGLERINVIDNNLEFEVKQRAYLDLENLFNGERSLSDNTNVFLNENWREMVQELGPPIAQALSAAVTQIMSNLSKSVPFNDIFPDTPVA
ncbi:hypothetical protein B566_EDAN009325 [Ephemera danica]|nr:hypothetical protein B566_EDAN009325 [Ephemera danica]